MEMKKWKLFWKIGDIPKHIISQSFDDDEEYYSFLKRQFDMGYRQVIVSSEAMIELIKYCVINLELNIYEIQLTEDDSALSEELSTLLEAMIKRPVLFNTLIEKLQFLSEESSIDINRIGFSGRLKNNSAITFYIQSNGIIAISVTPDNNILNQISTLIERCLFG